MADTQPILNSSSRPYFRRDQKDGVTPPDLSKTATFAEHIVHARGKRTQLTSVSLDLTKIWDFDDADYRLDRGKAAADGHTLIEHEDLLTELQRVAREHEKAERQRAIQALRYARMRKEGRVGWNFDIHGVDRKNLINWAFGKVQPYFVKV